MSSFGLFIVLRPLEIKVASLGPLPKGRSRHWSRLIDDPRESKEKVNYGEHLNGKEVRGYSFIINNGAETDIQTHKKRK